MSRKSGYRFSEQDMRHSKGGGLKRGTMLKRLTILSCLLAFGLTLSGCSKCGFWWDEWQSKPGACRGDFPK
jgi:hypothetical protein